MIFNIPRKSLVPDLAIDEALQIGIASKLVRDYKNMFLYWSWEMGGIVTVRNPDIGALSQPLDTSASVGLLGVPI